MFRSVVLAASRAVSTRAAIRPSGIPQRFSRLAFPQTKSFVPLGVRCYASGGGLQEDEVKGRIMDLLKNFDKVGLVCSRGVG
jgi:NADH dehydrogenase (ubiquinone) 1 alpha/beta subcomplex 1, acyl-carrier protein